MSVVVRMEMPKKCVNCLAWCVCGTIHKYMLGIDCDSDWTYDDLLVLTDETGFIKPDDCPIICQLPEGHGRLVDEKSVRWAIDDIVIEIAERIGHVPMTKNETMEYVNKLPTIVPAEAERSEHEAD